MRTFLNRRIGGGWSEAGLIQGVGLCGGLAVLVMASIAARSVAGRRELTILILAALLACLAMLFLGGLSRLLHEVLRKKTPYSRYGEYLGYATAVALLLVGAWQFPTLGFVGETDLRIGALLLFATCLATVSLGMLSTLVRAFKG
jgi:hypothetical protein